MLSRTKLAYPSRHSSLNSRPFNLLQPLCRLQKSQLLWNQANPASFCKTPGVGVPPQTSPLESSTSSLFFRAPVATQLTPQLTLMLLITSVQTQQFHAITHSFAQRRQPICFFFKGLRTLLPLTAISFFRSLPLIPDTAYISSRINTCKSVSKQTALSPFTINTYEKHGEGGPLRVGAQLRVLATNRNLNS